MPESETTDLPEWAKEMSSLDGSTWVACETCGNNADEIGDLDHKHGCPEADQDG